MNIETSSSNAATAIFQKSELSNSAKTQKTNQSGKSFKDELKTSSGEETKNTSTAETEDDTDKDKVTSKTEDKKIEHKDNKADNTQKQDDNSNNQSGNNQNNQNQQTYKGELSTSDMMNIQSGNFSSLSDEVKAYLQANGGMFGFNTANLMNASTRTEISNVTPAVDYTNIQMSDGDALFFADLVKNTDMSNQSIAGELQKALDAGNVQQVQSTAKASAALIAALQESSKTNQPFRIDFDKDVSVIIKVDKDGKINANFIPGDKAVENYLRNNIELLKNRFNEENIAYGDLNYSKSKQEKEEQRKQNNKENGHE